MLWCLPYDSFVRIQKRFCLAQVMEVHPLAVRDVSVQCALEDSCLVFFDDTSMLDALAAFDDTGKTVGMVQVGHVCCNGCIEVVIGLCSCTKLRLCTRAVQGDNGEVLGVLTRDSVVRALEEQLP